MVFVSDLEDRSHSQGGKHFSEELVLSVEGTWVKPMDGTKPHFHISNIKGVLLPKAQRSGVRDLSTFGSLLSTFTFSFFLGETNKL